jgi:rhomboid protease GluP
MAEMVINKNDEVVMLLLHYFITEQGYSPIVLHGANNEIWLENLDKPYKVVRIVTNYIHNDEQFDFDVFKTKQIIKKIKTKTLSLKVKSISLFLNLGENVHIEKFDNNDSKVLCIENLDDLKKYDIIKENFPNINNKMSFKEKGIELFTKLTGELNQKSEKVAKATEDLFKLKRPIITYALIYINIIVFILMYLIGNGSTDSNTLIKFGANFDILVKNGEYYRLITNAFVHIGILHILFNMYALYIIGHQVESFLGKTNYLIVYLFSAITASLLSLVFSTNTISAGASGAIFGLLGALLYFGYHYRIYLGGVMKSQIIPLIILNLSLGFLLTGIDNAGHIGGLIGGVLITMALGIKGKSTNADRINGVILSSIFTLFLAYLVFFVK